MRNTIVFIIFFFSFNHLSYCYVPFIKESANWSVLEGGYGMFNKATISGTGHYRLDGDSLIQSLKYKKVLVSNDTLQQNWSIVAFIREDTTEKKVWIRDLKNQDELLYDFGLSVGDSVSITNPFYLYSCSYKVSKIDTIVLQNKQRRQIHFLGRGIDESWIEGIGSRSGLLNVNYKNMTAALRELLCYSDYEVFYLNEKYDTCNKTLLGPLISNQNIDSAYVNMEYNFQIKLAEVCQSDKISFFVDSKKLPDGLALNTKTGLISGIPTEKGKFPIYIYVKNYEYITDYIKAELLVLDITGLSEQSVDKSDLFIISLIDSENIVSISSKNEEEGVELFVTDLSGKTVFNCSITRPTLNIDFSEFPVGLYFLSIKNKNNGRIVCKEKIMKR